MNDREGDSEDDKVEPQSDGEAPMNDREDDSEYDNDE
jgi:hypothetical protein